MKRALVVALVAMVLSLVAAPAQAANRYVRQGASGAANGTNWTDAYAALPGALVRGDTYYIADGTYPGYNFKTAVSGSTVITIKKATAQDHGTDTGWSAAYGDGQAVFTGAWDIETSHWVFDGQTRNENDWFDSGAYGFAVGDDTQGVQINIQNYGSSPDDVTIRYVYVAGWAAALPNTTAGISAVRVDDFDGNSESTGIVFSRMFVSGSCNSWVLRTTRGAILEYSAASGAKSNSENHGEIVNAYFSTFNAVVRYNQFKDNFKGSGGTALIAIAAAFNQAEKPQLDIYGNVFWNFDVGDGAIGFTGNAVNGGNCTGCRVFNNTFVDGNGGVQFPHGSGNFIQNNLWINAGNAIAAGTNGTVSHNSFGPGSNGAGTHAQVSVPTSIFSSYTGGVFTLASATAAGTSLAPPYNVDLRGVARGASGTWSRGAYEFLTPDATVPSPPTNLQAQ